MSIGGDFGGIDFSKLGGGASGGMPDMSAMGLEGMPEFSSSGIPESESDDDEMPELENEAGEKADKEETTKA